MKSGTTMAIRRLDKLSAAHIDALAQVLVDCVEGGASVSFMHPLSLERPRTFWHGIAQGLERGERALLAFFYRELAPRSVHQSVPSVTSL